MIVALIDNGSLEVAATLNLRTVAAELTLKVGVPVHPVSWKHSDRIPLANLDGDKLADLVIGDPSYQSPKDAGRVIAISGTVLSRSLAATK